MTVGRTDVRPSRSVATTRSGQTCSAWIGWHTLETLPKDVVGKTVPAIKGTVHVA